MRLVGLLAMAFVLALAVVLIPAAQRGYVSAAEKGTIELLEEATKVPEVGRDFSDVHKGYLREESPTITCGGYEAGEDAKTYYYGFKRLDGYCVARSFLANDSSEAWSCARAFCLNCSKVEDITDRFGAEEGRFAGSMLTSKYCPSR